MFYDVQEFALNDFVRSVLFTGTSRPLIFHGFRAITDQTFSKTGSKFKKCELTLNVNRLSVQKFGIPTPKAGKIQKMVKSLVNTDMRAQEPPVGVKRLKTKWVIYKEVD